MSSKAFIYLGLLLALFLLIFSEVAAGDLAEKNADSHGVNDAKFGGPNDYPGRGGRGHYDPPRGRRCYHRCCKVNRYGRGCDRCCSYAGEAMDSETETKPHN